MPIFLVSYLGFNMSHFNVLKLKDSNSDSLDLLAYACVPSSYGPSTVHVK